MTSGGPDPAEIVRRFGLGRPSDWSGPVARGEQGEVWRLDAGGRVYAVKATLPRFAAELDPERAERILEFQTAAARRGVWGPAAHRTRDGEASIRIQDTPVRVYDWVELDPPDRKLDPGRVGSLLAAMHRTVLPPDGRCDPWFTAPIGEAWDGLLTAATAAGAPFADRLAAHRGALASLEDRFTPMVPVQICHLDLWADNLRGTASGDLCVIDWDNCGPADPDRELAFCLVEFARGDPRRAERLVRAYLDAGGPGRVRGPAEFSMVAAVLGHIGEMWIRRWLDPDPRADRTRIEAGIDEFLTDPLTPAEVDGLLDAVAPLF